MSASLLNVMGIIIAVLNILLHGTGLYLLRTLRRTTLRGSQTILIFNLSLAELLLSVIQASKHLVSLCKSRDDDQDEWTKFYMYAAIVEYTGLAIVYYLMMIYITLHRWLKVSLGFRYRIYWSDRKTTILCNATWVLCGIISTTVFILKFKFDIEYIAAFYKYVYIPLDVMFLLCAMLTYTAIFRKHRFSRSQFKSRPPGPKQGSPVQKIVDHRNSRFYIPTLLIATFIVFVIVPDTLVIVYFIILKKDSIFLDHLVTTLYSISQLSDGIIYVFLQRYVRRLLLTKLRLQSRIQNTQDNEQIQEGQTNSVYISSPIYSLRDRAIPTIQNSTSTRLTATPTSVHITERFVFPPITPHGIHSHQTNRVSKI